MIATIVALPFLTPGGLISRISIRISPMPGSHN